MCCDQFVAWLAQSPGFVRLMVAVVLVTAPVVGGLVSVLLRRI